jgi:molecular chaperone GrpE
MENKPIEEIGETNITAPQEPDYKDQYLRLYADMENLKKRLNREKLESIERTKTKMIESILDIDNDLSIAIKNMGEIPEGVNLIVKKIQTFLKSQGIEEISTDSYDPDLHEVISVVNSEREGIVDVVSKGYTMGDKVVRYPKIILSRANG